ncbi:nuclear transport factor 2 family protein [Streptomyces sp. 372A]|uniref:nuclear transport factor 2 family protein n=1 Tax=Streptomyces sp. SAS_281 TaxID=3412744 RepID=UPI00403CE622
MSTTRHLVNRQRRLATVAAAERTATAAPPRPRPGRGPDLEKPGTARDDAVPESEEEDEGEAGEEPEKAAVRRRPRLSLPAVLCVLTLLLGAVAAWAFSSAAGLRDDPSRRNTALTDISRTSEVKGRITEAVGAVFSYDYASPAKAEAAVTKYLTGKAVQQHEDMLAEVRAQAPKQKLVLTTTVTDSGVEMLDGDRARLLIYADQRNTRTGKSEETTYAAAMFSVDAVRKDGSWRISAIDTFTR